VSGSEESARERNLATVRRFFEAFDTSKRGPLWADDAVFEMPFDRGGPVTIRGREAILRESDEWIANVARHDYFDLRIHATLDPEVFWISVKSTTVDKASRKTLTMQLVNYLRVVDGKVVHRIEYFDPNALPR